MDKQFHRLCALIPWLLLLPLGCARAPGDPAPAPPAVERSSALLGFEAQPSRAAAGLLAADAHYRVVLATNGELALVVVAPDQRILGRLHITADPGLQRSWGVQIEFDDLTGPPTRIQAWSSGEALYGQATIGERGARWRVRHASDGSLTGERWTSKRRGTAAVGELAALRRVQAIGADLGALALQQGDGLTSDCELAERLAFAELAIELSIRAWDGSGRAKLPMTHMTNELAYEL